MNRTIPKIMVIMLLIGLTAFTLNTDRVDSESTTIIVPDDYATIQEAINGASQGDTIFIRSGTHEETNEYGERRFLYINKTVALVGENAENTIVIADETNIQADNVSISGLTIYGYGYHMRGLSASNVWHLEISNSRIGGSGSLSSLVFLGGGNHSVNNCIVLTGLYLSYSENNRLAGSAFYNYGYGGYAVHISHSNRSFFFTNSFYGRNIGCLYMEHSFNNTFYHNNFLECDYTIPVSVVDSIASWDNGYPYGGNYWGTFYDGVDNYGGVYQNETGGDGLGDTPCLITPGHIDNYPLMNPLPRWEFDVSLSEILPEKTIVGSGYIVPINVTAKNEGFSESPVTFNLTVEATRIITFSTRYVDLQGHAVQGWNSTIPSPTITVNMGDTLNLTLEGLDNVHHKFYVDYNNNAFPDSGEPQTDPFINTTINYQFKANTLGNHTYYCAYNQETMYGILAVSYVTPPSPVKIESKNVTLTQGEEKTVTFLWNTTSYLKGNYTINAYTSPILGEWETSDNSIVANKEVCITIVGDVDGDRDVDIFDIVGMAVAYGSGEGDPAYNPNYDIDGDGDIDIFDMRARALTLFSLYPSFLIPNQLLFVDGIQNWLSVSNGSRRFPVVGRLFPVPIGYPFNPSSVVVARCRRGCCPWSSSSVVGWLVGWVRIPPPPPTHTARARLLPRVFTFFSVSFLHEFF